MKNKEEKIQGLIADGLTETEAEILLEELELEGLKHVMRSEENEEADDESFQSEV